MMSARNSTLSLNRKPTWRRRPNYRIKVSNRLHNFIDATCLFAGHPVVVVFEGKISYEVARGGSITEL